MKSWMKYTLIVVTLIGVTTSLLFLYFYLEWRTSDEYRAKLTYKKLENEYRNDIYGGTTPEETLQLFIDALRQKNVQKASLYFSLDKREELSKKLEDVEQSGNLQFMTDYLDRAETPQKLNDENYQVVIPGQDSNALVIINLSLNTLSGRWKIERF
jgi:hypothetical protein